jgi:hypothetical protein
MANKLVFSRFKKETLAIDGRKQAVGSISYYRRWGQHVFTPHVGNKLGSDHLEDILDRLSKMDEEMALAIPAGFGQSPVGSQNDKKAGS